LAQTFAALRRDAKMRIDDMYGKRKQLAPDLHFKEWQEALFIGWPAAKAHVAMVSGSLRSLQKLLGGIDDLLRASLGHEQLLLHGDALPALQLRGHRGEGPGP